MKTEQKIENHLKSLLDKDVSIKRAKGDFCDFLSDKTSASWGWSEPLSYLRHRIVYLQFSPKTKGCKMPVFYDYVTENEYQKMINA